MIPAVKEIIDNEIGASASETLITPDNDSGEISKPFAWRDISGFRYLNIMGNEPALNLPVNIFTKFTATEITNITVKK